MKILSLKSYIPLLLAPILIIAAEAAEIPAGIQKQMNVAMPGYDISSVKSTPIKGLYQFIANDSVLYISEDGRYAVEGIIFDLKERINLTKQAQRKVTQTLINSYDEKKMIVFQAEGETKNTITVFTDVDCPYCTKLHKEVPKLNKAGTTVRYLMFPRYGPGSPGFTRAVTTWCSSDQKEAIGIAKDGGKVEGITCDNPVQEQFDLGQKIGIRGTPALILESGEVLSGFVPADDLIKMLDNQ